MRIVIEHYRRPLIVLSLMLVAVLAASPPAAPQVLIDNGTIQLGINPQGHLNVAVPPGSPPGLSLQDQSGLPNRRTTDVGLRLMSNNSEGTAPLCDCEGWGASGQIAGVPFQGGATGFYLAFVPDFVSNLTVAVEPKVLGLGTANSGSSGDEFISVTTINGPSGFNGPFGPAALRVTHHFHPRSGTPNLYQVDVIIENISGTPVTDVRYRRVMDWDIAPTIRHELVTIHVGDATRVIEATNDGFVSPRPLDQVPTGNQANVSPLFRLTPGISGAPAPAPCTAAAPCEPGAPLVRAGPRDSGAMFDFTFGELAAGGSPQTFQIFYGAAATEDAATAAMRAAKVEVYSLGQPNPNPDPTLGIPGTGRPIGEPNTFIFGFKEVGGTPAFQATNSPPVAMCQDRVVFTSPGTCWVLSAAVMAAVNGGSSDPDPTDSITFALDPPGPFVLGPPTIVTLTVTDSTNVSDFCTASVTVVDNEAPTITCPEAQIVECTGPAGATAFLTPLARDNCGNVSAICSAPATFPLGPSTVTCSATDTSGNTSSSCNATVTVVDSTPPTVSCVAVLAPRPRKHAKDDRDRDHHGRDDHRDGDDGHHHRANHHRDGDKHHHRDCDERHHEDDRDEGYRHDDDQRHRGRDDHHHDRNKPHRSDRKHDGHCGPTSSFTVTASDLCSPVTISLGGVPLANGEVIGIRQSRRPGVSHVSRSRGDRDDHHRQSPVRTFMVGPGPVVITATDAAGNVATATCPLPPKKREDSDGDSENEREREHNDRDAKKGRDRERDDQDSKRAKDREPEHKDSRKGKKS